jgi:hypothetical protein
MRAHRKPIPSTSCGRLIGSVAPPGAGERGQHVATSTRASSRAFPVSTRVLSRQPAAMELRVTPSARTRGEAPRLGGCQGTLCLRPSTASFAKINAKAQTLGKSLVEYEAPLRSVGHAGVNASPPVKQHRPGLRRARGASSSYSGSRLQRSAVRRVSGAPRPATRPSRCSAPSRRTPALPTAERRARRGVSNRSSSTSRAPGPVAADPRSPAAPRRAGTRRRGCAPCGTPRAA